MSKHVCALATILLLGPVSAEGVHAAALGSAFTYQGQLASGGMLVDGTADMQFRLYDAASTGNQVGSQIQLPAVPVSGGIFTVQLDFGVPAFNGDARWLEIDVRSPSGSGTFETLSPRQALTSSPYSLQTRGIYVDGANQVGIGTTAPAAKLHVVGAASPRIRLENSGPGNAGVQVANANQGYEWRVTGADRMSLIDNTAGDAARITVDTSGNVGIGTATPGTPLEIRGTGPDALRVESSNTTVTRLTVSNTAPGGLDYSLISTANGSGVGPGLFGVRNNSDTSLPLRIDSNGHVGIGGATSATNRLNVIGNVECSVLQINGGSDIAEPFEITAAEEIVPGMVVSIDPENPAGLRLATDAYDRTVAGVVSGAGGIKPGMMLRQEGTSANGAHPVALTGRVYCYVDADANGAVQPGDLLTTSDRPGHAMRVDDPQRASGAILGKALTGLERGRGLVLVLVSLQ
jgi:hypothetical protein